MNWKHFVRNVTLTLTISQFGLASVVVAEQLCEDKARFVGSCFTVNGRLFVSNGTPSVRLIPMGTKNQLGVMNDGEAANRSLPDEIAKVISTDKRIHGQFEVCPLAKLKPSDMQMVCLVSVKSLIVGKGQ